MNAIDVKTPPPVMGLYDKPMWESISARAMRLQRCRACSGWQYPPGPSCPQCLSCDLEWKEISGKGKILSWVVFHRKYLAAYPAPYNCVAVRLEEGPTMISNLTGDMPGDDSIGQGVAMVYVEMQDGFVLPRFQRLDRSPR